VEEELSMTVHQCPKCELRFTHMTELDDHCGKDHPNFHHDYPVRGVRHWDVETAPSTEPAKPATA
jgi:hypothetical protein